MKLKGKSFNIIICLISVSFFTQFPQSSKAPVSYYFPPFFNPSTEFISYTGHDLSEDNWSLLYDFSGNNLIEDFSPDGPYTEYINNGTVDDDNSKNASFFITWNNLQNVHSLYFAMQNHSWNTTDPFAYGCAPLQYFFQDFQIPGSYDHIFTLNKFLGLLMYQDGPDGIKNVPDDNDSLYLGWPQYSSWHKYLINNLFNDAGVNPLYYVNDSIKGSAEPIPVTYDSSTKSYEYGMSYKNIFLLWQDITTEDEKDENINQTTILDDSIAFSLLSSINFTFNITLIEQSGYKWINTTTQYDIGEINELWMIGDNSSIAQTFNGTSFNVSDTYFGHYNSTMSIGKRLDGNSSIPKFSLAILNTANVAVVTFENLLWGFTEFEGIDIGNFTDQWGDILGELTENITTINYNSGNHQSYTIDFASKPFYIWNNGTSEVEYEALNRILRNSVINLNATGLINTLSYDFIFLYIARILGIDFLGELTEDIIDNKILTDQCYYLTCFPYWSGAKISHDPIFSISLSPKKQIFPLFFPEDEANISELIIPISFFIGIIFIVLFTIVLSLKAYLKNIKNRTVSIEKGSHQLDIEEVLENENRIKIIDTILKNPGIHYNDLLRKVKIAPGNLAWHLDILETYKVIRKKRIQNYLILLPYYSENPLSNIDLKLQKSELTLKVLELIKENPGIWNSKISEELETHRKTLEYHIEKLIDLDLIYKKRDGNKKRLFPNLEKQYFDS
jgi:predicted transcriptional regulator